jgi:hypothetical protein
MGVFELAPHKPATAKSRAVPLVIAYLYAVVFGISDNDLVLAVDNHPQGEFELARGGTPTTKYAYQLDFKILPGKYEWCSAPKKQKCQDPQQYR